jgi:hypothetical protein
MNIGVEIEDLELLLRQSVEDIITVFTYRTGLCVPHIVIQTSYNSLDVKMF